MKKLNDVRQLLLDAPVIAAVKDDRALQRALDSECQVIFLLYGTILNLQGLVEQIHSRGKLCFIHLDLVEGLSSREIAVEAAQRMFHPDGIISTKLPLIRRAQQLGLLAIQRVFLLDSMSLSTLLGQLDTVHPDFIEVLPGILPDIIREITEKTQIPLIAGGLIRGKQDVFQALQAGVVAVSTSSQAVWEM